MINSTIKEFEIDGVEYIAQANIQSMFDAEKLSGRHFVELVMDVQKGFLEPFVMLISTCIKFKDEKRGVGMDYVCSLSKAHFEQFIEPLLEVVVEALPKEEKGKK